MAVCLIMPLIAASKAEPDGKASQAILNSYWEELNTWDEEGRF